MQVLKQKACTLNNSKTGFHRLCTTGLNEGWSKGHRADRLSMTTLYLLLKEQHLCLLCTTCHGMVWADLDAFYKWYCILKNNFSSFFPPSEKRGGRGLKRGLLLLAITSHKQHSATLLDLGKAAKAQKGYIFVLLQFTCALRETPNDVFTACCFQSSIYSNINNLFSPHGETGDFIFLLHYRTRST